MLVLALKDALSICKDAAGIAGNVFAFGLFISPMPTFRRIIRNRSTEQFSGLPYLYTLLNCLICLWYGSPFVSADNLMVMTVNSIGAVFQFVYTILFIKYADKKSKIKMLGLFVAVFAVFLTVVIGSLQIPDPLTRWYLIGLLSCASLISMFSSPLFVIKLVIQTKSVEFMPFYLSLSTFLMSTAFCLYGAFNSDAFVYAPNGIGSILGIVQLALYFHYRTKPGQDSTKEPLIESYVY